MSRMTVVVFCPSPGPAPAALCSALAAGLGDVRPAPSVERAAAHCAAEPRAVLVMDLRAGGRELSGAALRLRRLVPTTRALALVTPGTAAPPDCDAVLTAPMYLTEVVCWCARALRTPSVDGALPDIVAGLSHEIGNALTALQLQVELLRVDDVSPGLAEHLEQIRSAGERIQAVVADVTRATDRPPVAPEATRLRRLLTEARRSLDARDPALGGRVQVECEDQALQAETPLVGSALADVWQYLLLAGNGADALEVRAGPADGQAVAIRVHARVPRLPEGSADRLFIPLWARQALGLPAGLSLSSARAAFLRHGGDLRAHGRGDRLTVEGLLPRDVPGAA
jgi:signal transduction histidine kinase